MPTSKIIQEVANKIFCQRVAFLALRAAQKVVAEKSNAEDFDARAAYANQIFRGEDRALLLTLHVVAASSAIEAALENGTHEDVQDADIEAALKEIWEARATAYASVNEPLNRARRVMMEAAMAREDAANSVNEVRQTLQLMKDNKMISAGKKVAK
jgi:hypothetical protein